MQISLPSFREAFPEALIRRSPSPSHPPTPPRHLPGLWSRSARRVASFDGPQGRWTPPSPSWSHSSAASILSNTPPSPHSYTLSRSPPTKYISTVMPPTPRLAHMLPSVPTYSSRHTHTHTHTHTSRRANLPCPEHTCDRAYSCIGNLNRHRRLAHGTPMPTRTKTKATHLPQTVATEGQLRLLAAASAPISRAE